MERMWLVRVRYIVFLYPKLYDIYENLQDAPPKSNVTTYPQPEYPNLSLHSKIRLKIHSNL